MQEPWWRHYSQVTAQLRKHIHDNDEGLQCQQVDKPIAIEKTKQRKFKKQETGQALG